MDSIRKTYQKAVTLPLANVEQIWSEYNHWEQNLNKLTVSGVFSCVIDSVSLVDVLLDTNSGEKIYSRVQRSLYDCAYCFARNEATYRQSFSHDVAA